MTEKRIFFFVILFFFLIGTGSVFVSKKRGQAQPQVPQTQKEITPEAKTNIFFEKYFLEGFVQKSKGDQGEKGAYQKAIAAYKTALEYSPRSYLVWHNLATIYTLTREYDKAENAYEKALALAPNQESLWLGVINFYRNERKKPYEFVRSVYLHALQNIPQSANLIGSFAQYLKETNHRAEAREYFEVLSKRFPKEKYYQDELRVLR